MKTVKTSELTGVALDWAVAKCEGFVQADDPPWEAGHEPFAYSTDWALAGPIIERERIGIGHAWNRPVWPDYSDGETLTEPNRRGWDKRMQGDIRDTSAAQ